MNPHQLASTPLRARRLASPANLRVARVVLSRLAIVAFGMMSVLGLGGCRAVEAIFKVGVWFGVLIVVAIVAVVGGIAAMVMKKK